MSGCSTPQTAESSGNDGADEADETSVSSQKWGYSGDTGPEYWADLDDDYHLCETGKNQSPIDIATTRKANLPELAFEYGDTAEAVVRKPTSVELSVPEGNVLEVDGKAFELEQFHFHSPAEHTIAGETYPLELHLVHESADGESAVVAVLYESGDQHREIYKVLNYLPAGKGESRQLQTADISPSALLPEDRSYYRYNGSLTTPPCTEGVRWYVMKQTPSVSTSQIDSFKRAVGGPNARPVQPLNARVVLE